MIAFSVIRALRKRKAKKAREEAVKEKAQSKDTSTKPAEGTTSAHAATDSNEQMMLDPRVPFEREVGSQHAGQIQGLKEVAVQKTS